METGSASHLRLRELREEHGWTQQEVADQLARLAWLRYQERVGVNADMVAKWERGEKSARRIHKKPNDAEIRACHPWLEEEIRLVDPQVIVCLGATAAQAIMGKSFRVTKERGRPVKSPGGEVVIATVHPSSVLRAPDPEARAQAERDFMSDIKKVAKHLE